MVFIVLFLIFGVGLYLIIAGSVLPFVLTGFPIGITITNIILGVVLIVFSILVIVVSAIVDNQIKRKKSLL